jgi:hypothetical protein
MQTICLFLFVILLVIGLFRQTKLNGDKFSDSVERAYGTVPEHVIINKNQSFRWKIYIDKSSENRLIFRTVFSRKQPARIWFYKQQYLN